VLLLLSFFNIFKVFLLVSEKSLLLLLLFALLLGSFAG
jgi:hypothetical protein